MGESGVRVFLGQYWNHYIALERELLDTTSYVAISPVNHDTFSMRYYMIFEMVCSEIDVLCKELIRVIKMHSDEDRMDCYCAPICEKYTDFINRKVKCIDYDIELEPWSKWGTEYISNGKKAISTPKWWRDYNACKHDRTATRKGKSKPNYMYANQRNVLHALAALFQLNMYCFRELRNNDPRYLPDMPNPPSELFQMVDWGNVWVTQGRQMALMRVQQ